MKSNRAYIYNMVCRTALMVLCVASLFSCVKVDLCSEDEHPHTGNISIVYHWPDSIDSERPDSMLVLVNRVVNTRRVGYVTGSENSVGGRYRFGKSYNAVDSIDKYPLMVSAGEYQIFAFNNDIVDINKGGMGLNDVLDYTFENLYEYGDDQNVGVVGIHDLAISYVARDITDPRLDLYGKDWVDFNQYAKYIATDVKPIYRAVNPRNEETQEYTFNVRAEQEVEVHLYPQKITQDITFAFPIYTDGRVAIDSIIAEISGIPCKMMLYTGALVVDTTYKMLFKVGVDREHPKQVMLPIVEKGGTVDRPFNQLDCMATISVMGLIPNESPSYRTGAGILQLCVYSHATDAQGEVKRKTQYAKINMYNTIKNAHLLITDELGNVIQNPGTYYQLPRTDTLRIENSHLIITKDLVLQTTDDDNSLDTWAEGEDGSGKDDRLDIEI